MLLKDVFPAKLLARSEHDAREVGEQKMARIREIEAEMRTLERGAGFGFYHKIIGNALISAQHHIGSGNWNGLHHDLELALRALINYKEEV